MSRSRKMKKSYGFFLNCGIPTYLVIKNNRYIYALHWYDEELQWTHDESDLEDILAGKYVEQLNFVEWIKAIKNIPQIKFPRHLVGYTARQAKRLFEIFDGAQINSDDKDLFCFSEISSLSEISGLKYIGEV